MATPITKLFEEIRDTARHDLKRLEKHIDYEDSDALSEAELAVMEQLRRTLELTVLVIDSFLDE